MRSRYVSGVSRSNLDDAVVQSKALQSTHMFPNSPLYSEKGLKGDFSSSGRMAILGSKLLSPVLN